MVQTATFKKFKLALTQGQIGGESKMADGLSCHDFVDNQVRLQLFVLAYNLG
jgi:hypothetical protein